MPNPTTIASASSSPVAAGSFDNLVGPGCANGYLKIKLVMPNGAVASLTGGGEVMADLSLKITLDANSVPSAGQTMFISSQFSSPVNPAFTIQIFSANDNLLGTIQNAVITGAAPVDLTILTPTSNGSSFINALLLGTGTVTSSQLATALTDETGTGLAVFNTSPQLVTPNIGAATASSVTAAQIIQPAATTFLIEDNHGGTRYSIPAGGVAQATINNTSLTGASNANTVTGINDQGTTGAITGTGAPAVVYTYTLPASIVATGKRIHVRVVFAHVGANSVSYTLSLNGVAMLTFATSAANPQVIDADILNTGAASGQEYGFFSTNAAFTPFANTTASGFLWTSNQVLQLTQTVAATDSVSGLGWNVSLP